MRGRPLQWCVGVFGLMCATATPTLSQGIMVSAPTTTLDGSPTQRAVLGRQIALHLNRATLDEALVTVAKAAGIRLTYSRYLLPLDRRISLDAETITVGDALAVLLRDTDVVPEVAPNGRVMLVRTGSVVDATATIQQQGTAGVTGVVTDSVTGAVITQATVRLDGTAIEARVNKTTGAYSITGVAPGEYRLTARRVGYMAQTRTVTLVDGQTATLNFALNQPATKLDEVVTTAVGDQRRYQVGNVISTINVDSIAPNAPVTSVTDMIAGRAPGVEIVQENGMTGSGSSIRIRGIASLTLSSDPIIIVDGIRQDNNPGTTNSNLFGPMPSPSRINDIDFTQIETIDVLKGPAAATEYGTDAENGVIVITTKHGTSGSPQWHANAEQDVTGIPHSLVDQYWSWGHATNGTRSRTATSCALYPSEVGSAASTNGQCVVDSITHFNPLNDNQTSYFQQGSSDKYDLSVAGGSDLVRYYVAGNLAYSNGNTRLPVVFRSLAQSVGFPSNQINAANTETQRSVRSNMQVKLSKTADMSVNVAYLSTLQNAPGGSSGGIPFGTTPELPDSAYYYGYGSFGSSPLSYLGQQNYQTTNRLTGGLQFTWRPTSWLLAKEITGVDHGSQSDLGTYSPQSQLINIYGYGAGQNMNSPYFYGYRSLQQGANDIYSSDFRTTVTLPLSRILRSITSFGVQVNMDRASGVQATSFNVTTGNPSLNGSTSPSVNESSGQSATMGGYLEEQLAFFDRVFVSGAVRVDAGSGFWNGYQTQKYPKASVSWLAIQKGGTTLRLRGALGANGQQPPDGSSDQIFASGQTYTNGANVASATLQSPGDLGLRAETSTEVEGGADATLWDNRVSLEFTAYDKTTHNTLFSQALGFDLGNQAYEENLGEVTNDGFEAAATVALVQMRSFAWNVTVNGSINKNKLIHVNNNLLGYYFFFGTQQHNRAGYPLYSYFGYPVMYGDANHDGILEPSEVTRGDSLDYAGQGLPEQEISVSSNIELFRSLSVGALFDYEGKFVLYNQTAAGVGLFSSLAEQNVLGSPLWKQAGANANQFGVIPLALFEDGTFLRWRELNMTYALPVRFARQLRVSSLSFTAAVRNLALWTRFSEGDPEVSSPSGGETVGNPVLGTSTINGDLRETDANAIPLPRAWFFRINVGF